MTVSGRTKPVRCDEAGFTLVEVLVAFAIVALTLVMALRVLADGAGWARRGPAQAERIEEAASIVGEIVADPHPGERDGVFADGVRWRVRSTDVTTHLVPGSKTRLLRIELFLGGSASRPLFVTLASGSAQ